MRERRHSFNKREFYKKRRYRPSRSFNKKSKKPYRFRKKSYYKKRAAKPTEQEAAEGILGGLWWLLLWPFRRGKIKRAKLKSLDKERVRSWWEEVEEMEKKGDFRGVILESDKILNYTLEHMNFPGESFAQRLNSARSRFSPTTYNNLWEAHRSRNRVVHETGHEINAMEARNAKKKFRHGLKELGIL